MHTLPELDATILGIEVGLLPDWYWPEVHGAPMPADLRAEYDLLWRPVIDMLLAAPKGWILRDVHSPNLLWLPERLDAAKVGVIDFQDAIAGPWAHDVMSLLQDARVDVSADLEAILLARYVAQMAADPGFDEALFHAAYAAYGALRATRLLGLFVRLLRRDGKPGYLQHLPRNWGYLERNLQHPALQQLGLWYGRHFPPAVRKRAILP
jgi:aminoglycoside/choline kinase family phosphotransferase